MKDFIRLLGEIIILAIVTGLIAVVLVEWAVGCGETWTDSRGETHIGQCVFINSNQGE